MSESSGSSGGISVVGLLGVAFVVLKLTKVISWSWWWVLLPFYVWIPIVLVFFSIAVLVAAIKEM